MTLQNFRPFLRKKKLLCNTVADSGNVWWLDQQPWLTWVDVHMLFVSPGSLRSLRACLTYLCSCPATLHHCLLTGFWVFGCSMLVVWCRLVFLLCVVNLLFLTCYSYPFNGVDTLLLALLCWYCPKLCKLFTSHNLPVYFLDLIFFLLGYMRWWALLHSLLDASGYFSYAEFKWRTVVYFPIDYPCSIYTAAVNHSTKPQNNCS